MDPSRQAGTVFFMALSSTRHFWRHVIVAGLICGLLDITAALVSYVIRTHKDPERVFRFIASGIFGKKAMGPENSYVVWGALLHFFIAFAFALFFFLVLPYIQRYLGNWIIRGILY